jgi:chitin disaccharide deacetylase
VSISRPAELIDWAVRRLIVNADDFGLTRGVNRAVLELHRSGLLSSATMMANAPATNDSVALALQTPSLGVGCHVVLVDGVPQLPAGKLPGLSDHKAGNFHRKLGSFLGQLFAGRIQPAEIEAEVAAQISHLQSSGLRLTHVDTHKHTHMFPAVLRPLLRAARAAGILAVRNPFEPAWSRKLTTGAPIVRRTEVNLLRLLEPGFRRIVAEEGFFTTDGAIGVLATGTLDEPTVRSLLRNLPRGTWELVTHPGYNDEELDALETRLKASRQAETVALKAIGEEKDLELISFAGLPCEV